MNNFKCEDCGFEFFESSYTISYIEGAVVFRHKGSLLSCQECKGNFLSPIEKKGEFNVSYGRFNSMSNDDKKRILKKRANDHTNKRGKERIDIINNKFSRP